MIVIINLTPAFANQIGDIAHEAEEYNIESQKEKGFFAKISFITKGFKLVNKAEKAQEASNNVKKDDDQDLDEYKMSRKQYVTSELQKQHLITFQKAKSVDVGKIEPLNMKNINNKSLGNNTNTSQNTGNSTGTIPTECFNHADYLITSLNGLILSQNIHGVDSGLLGQMVQLTDNGYLRYAYVNNIVLTGSNPHIVLLTRSGNEITMKLDEFTKQYTGITLNIKEGQNPGSVLDSILEIETNDLKKVQEENTELRDQAKHELLVNGILMGLSIVLIVVGILLATIFGKQIVQAYQSRTFPDGTHFKGMEFANDNAFESYMYQSNSVNSLDVISNANERILSSIVTKTTGGVVAELVAAGFAITAMSTPELVAYVASQNWIKVVLCTVGIILFLAGIALGIYSIIQLVNTGMNWWYTAKILRTNREDSDALDKWAKDNETKEQTNKPVDNFISKNNTLNRHGGNISIS